MHIRYAIFAQKLHLVYSARPQGQKATSQAFWMPNFDHFKGGFALGICSRFVLVLQKEQEQKMKILGIDPGLRQTGWAILQIEGQNRTQINAGTIKTESKQPLAIRLAHIFDQLEEIIKTHSPDEVAVEETFVNKDPVSALKLGHARAMALLAPARAALPVAEYAPNTIKKTVVGAGHADKSQIAYMINLQIKNAKFDSNDAADALAIALCHSYLRRARQVA